MNDEWKEKELESKFWLKIVASMIIGVLCLVAIIFTYDYQKDAQYLRAGYQKTAIMGPVGFKWQKTPGGAK